MNERALNNLSYGVYIISTWDGNRPTGCIANSVMQITSEPAAIAVSMSHNNYTTQCIEKSGGFAISILGENSDPSIIGTFGFQSGKDVNKYDSVDYDVRGDMPIATAGCAYVICKVINQVETETHTVFIAQILDADILSADEVMTYAYYHKVIKGKSPKNAPTYQTVEDTSGNVVKQDSEKYVCNVCGYVYKGDIPFEELPDDYICPICKKPKSVFVQQS